MSKKSRKSLYFTVWITFFYGIASNSLAETPTLPGTQKTDSINLPIRYEKLRESYNKIDAELEKSQQRLQQLTAELQLQQTALDVLNAENQKLRDSERTTFFIYGVCAVLLGAILTLAIPKLRPRKRYSEWR